MLKKSYVTIEKGIKVQKGKLELEQLLGLYKQKDERVDDEFLLEKSVSTLVSMYRLIELTYFMVLVMFASFITALYIMIVSFFSGV